MKMAETIREFAWEHKEREQLQENRQRMLSGIEKGKSHANIPQTQSWAGALDGARGLLRIADVLFPNGVTPEENRRDAQ
jgi:hypothetical protein